MAEEETEVQEPESKGRSSKPLLLGLVAALVLGAGSFYAVWSGLLLGSSEHPDEAVDLVADAGPLPDVVFIPVQPLVINIGNRGVSRHLRFQAQLEVDGRAEAEVTRLLPRVVDVLNGYLRAVDASELEERAALVRLRAQMLRRVQVVTGEGRVRDLLIMEFVLS